MRRLAALVLIAASQLAMAQPGAAGGCGEVVTLATHGGTTTRYSLAQAASAPDARITLVMMIGGGGFLDLDNQGCARLLNRNVLVRMRPLLREAGIATALVDAPSDLKSEDGLAGFRIAPATRHRYARAGL